MGVNGVRYNYVNGYVEHAMLATLLRMFKVAFMVVLLPTYSLTVSLSNGAK